VSANDVVAVVVTAYCVATELTFSPGIIIMSAVKLAVFDRSSSEPISVP